MVYRISRIIRRSAVAALAATGLLTAGCGGKSEFSASEKVRDYVVESLWYDTIPYKWETRQHLDTMTFRSPKDTEELFRTMSDYLWHLHMDSRDHEALFVLQNIASILKSDPNPTVNTRKILMRTYARLGATFADLGMPAIAADYYKQGLDFGSDTVFNKERAMLYNNFGILYAESDMYDKAISSFEGSLAINTNRNDRQELLLNYMNLAKLEWMRDSLDRAYEWTEQGIHVMDTVRERDKLASYRLLQASILTRKGEYARALPLLKECEEYYEGSSNPIGVVDAYTNLADYHFRTGDFNQAIAYSSRALEIAKVGHRTDAMFAAGAIKADAYRAMGRRDMEADVFRRMERRRDSLQKAEYRARIDARNQAEISVLKYTIPQDHTLEWILGAGNVLFIGLFIWALRRRRQ